MGKFCRRFPAPENLEGYEDLETLPEEVQAMLSRTEAEELKDALASEAGLRPGTSETAPLRETG